MDDLGRPDAAHALLLGFLEILDVPKEVGNGGELHSRCGTLLLVIHIEEFCGPIADYRGVFPIPRKPL